MQDKIKKAKRVILESYLKYKDKTVIACSFGKDSIVTIDLALQVAPDINIISVLTPMKFIETWEFAYEVMKHFNKKWQIYSLSETTNLYKNNPDKCCDEYKVLLIDKSLKPYDAWITGLRNTEGVTRKDYKYIETDKKRVKYNPILEFTEVDIWKYIAWRKLPVHPLYMQGYRSLGCEPCSGIIQDNQCERDGRWAGTKKQGGECGIHSKKNI